MRSWRVLDYGSDQGIDDVAELAPIGKAARKEVWMARRTWLDGRVEVLLGELGRRGLSLPRAVAADLIRDKLTSTASGLRVTERTARQYLDDAAIIGIAQHMGSVLAEEEPGLNLLDDAAARTSVISALPLGRGVAGLAEAIGVHLVTEGADTARAHVTELAQLLSAFGQLIAETGDTAATTPLTAVPVPPALLLRAARYLERAAEISTGTSADADDLDIELAAALRRDATRLRTIAAANR